MAHEISPNRWGARRLAAYGLLLVPLLAVLALGSNTLALGRGAADGQGGLLDARSFAPLAQAKPVPLAKKAPADTDEVPEVQLRVWENTLHSSK